MRPDRYFRSRTREARQILAFAVALSLPAPCAAQGPEPIWSFDTEG